MSTTIKIKTGRNCIELTAYRVQNNFNRFPLGETYVASLFYDSVIQHARLLRFLTLFTQTP
jgi:hypothetical protein